MDYFNPRNFTRKERGEIFSQILEEILPRWLRGSDQNIDELY